MPPVAELYRAVRGQNVVVNTMRSMGYRYVHFENGYDNLTRCPIEGAICIKGNVRGDSGAIQFDEFNLAVLSKTPLVDLIAAFTDSDRSPFMRGAVHELTDKLPGVPE